MAYTNTKTGEIIADYTVFYKDYKETFGALDLSMFPTVTINENDYDFAAMFEARNAYKEIGAETPEYFKAIADRRIKEAALIFVPKINEWKEHLADLWSREQVHVETTADDFFLNPTVSATSAAAAPKLQSTSKSTYNHHITFGQGVSNAEMLRQIMEVETIFYSALEFLDNLFITLY
jgi:hypothetical protein